MGKSKQEVLNLNMVKKRIKVFKTFKEQEMDFLEYFFNLTPGERLQALASLQKKNSRFFAKAAEKNNTP